MALRVLCGVEEEAEDVGRQLHPPDSARFEKSIVVGRPQLSKGSLDLIVKRCYQVVYADALAPGRLFRRQRLALRIGQPLAAGVREQPVYHAGDVLQVEAHRSHASRPGPQEVRGEVRHKRTHVSAGLEQRVRHGLQVGRHVANRTSEPEFGFGFCHRYGVGI